jgi:hypothetical protein
VPRLNKPVVASAPGGGEPDEGGTRPP